MINPFAENPNGGISALKAQNALCFHYNICYDQQGTPKSNTPRRDKAYINKEELLSQLNNATAFPNPASDFTTIDFKLQNHHEDTKLILFDALGRNISSYNIGSVYAGQQIIDTRKLNNGVFIYEIVQNGKRVVNGKFIVNR